MLPEGTFRTGGQVSIESKRNGNEKRTAKSRGNERVSIESKRNGNFVLRRYTDEPIVCFNRI